MPEDNSILMDGRIMSMSEYLYGYKSSRWDDMKYFEALNDRAECAEKLYKKLNKTSKNGTIKLPYSDEVRMHKVYKAWQHNLKLIEERTKYI